MSQVVSLQKSGDFAVVLIDSPPVNALSRAVREGLLDAFNTLQADDSVLGVVLSCAGGTFVAGADIKEFSTGGAITPDMNDIHRLIENLGKPVVAAIHGTALGGGFELALACHYRVALASAQVGLPEVTLGVLPGAGGTQRTVRLAGADAALGMMLSGAPISAKKAMERGLIDSVVKGDVLAEGKAFVAKLVVDKAPLKHVSQCAIAPTDLARKSFVASHADMAGKARSPYAGARIIECVEAAVSLPIEEGLAFERQKFMDCVVTPEAVALQKLFFAEREATRIPNLPQDIKLRPIRKVGIVGAGTMGGGIAMNFVNVGIPVRLLEVQSEFLERGLSTIRKNYESSAAKGKMTAEQVAERMALLEGTLNYNDFSDCDLAIEAVFENMDIKKTVCAKLASVCKPGAIIATNTSTLDVDVLAAVTGRPEDVLGMHFFSPANVMRLVEVVRGARTAPDALARAMKISKQIGKVAVVSSVCYGFIGNRMLEGYIREAEFLVMEGASPQQIDRAIEAYGMAMGPCRMMDMAGVDVGAKVLLEWEKAGGMPKDPSYRAVVRELFARGRFGQKTGAGYYRYAGRNVIADAEVDSLAEALAATHGIKRRSDISNEEIVTRCLYPLINEGAKILEEGIAYRAGDINVVWTSGYGFPARKGGPMHQADVIGAGKILEGLTGFAKRFGNEFSYWTPAPLLVRLAAEQGRFSA